MKTDLILQLAESDSSDDDSDSESADLSSVTSSPIRAYEGKSQFINKGSFRKAPVTETTPIKAFANFSLITSPDKEKT